MTTYTASRIFSFPRLTKMLLPDRIEVLSDRARVTKKTLLGISSQTKEVLFERVSSVRLDTRIFTAVLVIETSGGSIEDIRLPRVTRSKARKLRDHLSTQVNANGSGTTSTSIPAGWYLDSYSVTRWWDGYQWTDHVQETTS